MLNRRWWDLAIAGSSIVIVVALFAGLGSPVSAELAATLASIAAFGMVYLVIARPAIGAPAGWRYPAFLVVGGIVIGIACGIAPFLAMLQTIAYPLVWVLADDRRRAVIGSAVIALAVWAGFFVGGGMTWQAFLSGTMTAVLSFTFAVAFGLWITAIAEYGEERGRLLDELTAAQAQVEALSRDRGAAAERERMGRDIHDTLAQTLAGLVILTDRASRQLDEGHADAASESIRTVEQLARDALGEARALVARTAAVPADAAFDEAVERLVERLRSEAVMTIDLRLDTDGAALDREAQVVLLRCLQEALSNVRKHAGSNRVEVVVSARNDGSATLEVRDDGRGFDPFAARAGFGLDGMSERVGLAGGRLDVESSPGAGATLRVRLPAENVREDA